MAAHFDPYYKWLGISPQNQPPDLYRLLALERFESDLEVIEAAANRQMIYIQGCAAGPYVEHSQKLLNEIAAARLCLLDVRRKTEYDAELRDKLAAGAHTVRLAPPVDAPILAGTRTGMDAIVGSAVPPPAPARPKARPAEAPIAIHDEPSTRSARRVPRKQGQPVITVLVLGFLAVIVLAVAGYLLLRSEGSKGGTLSSLLPSGTNVKPSTPAASTQPETLPGAGTTSSPGLPKKKAPPEFPPFPTAPPAADPPTSQPASEELFREAEEALSRRDLNAAVQSLTKVADDPSATKRPQAQALLAQIATVTANDWARQQLSQLDNASLEMFRQGKMQFQFQGLHPALVSVAHETLNRNLPEVMKSRGMNPPPNRPPPGQPMVPEKQALPDAPAVQNPAAAPDTPSAPQKTAAEPTDPVELLKSRGLKRVWNTWILNDEARCMELIEKAKEAEQHQREIQKEVTAARKKVELARRSLERDEAAVKRAEATGDPLSGTPAHDKLVDRATSSREAHESAAGDLSRVSQDHDAAARQAADALSEARRLAGTLDDQYRKMTVDPQIQDSLRQLEQKLGPSDEFKALRGDLNRVK